MNHSNAKTHWAEVAIGLSFILVLAAYIPYVKAEQSDVPNDNFKMVRNTGSALEGAAGDPAICKLTKEGYCDLATPELRQKWEETTKPKAVKIQAIRTKYSRADSCHNKKRVGNATWCLTAIGRDTKQGTTVACPRNIKLGTHIRIEGHEYICEDRYSAYLDKERPLPTFDVFAEASDLAKLPSYKQVEVTILN